MKAPDLPLPIKLFCLLSLSTAIISTPVLANKSANFGKLSLTPGFKPMEGKVTGYTGGSYPLSAITNRDRNKNFCIGFADTKPDHILVLEKDFSNLTIKIDSGGHDTTLLLKAPDNKTVICGDDTGKNKDASIKASKLKAGKYSLWVGIFKSGVRRNYTLSVEQ